MLAINRDGFFLPASELIFLVPHKIEFCSSGWWCSEQQCGEGDDCVECAGHVGGFQLTKHSSPDVKMIERRVKHLPIPQVITVDSNTLKLASLP